MISAGGSALLGCAANPSDPRRRRRQAQQKDLPLPWPPHGGAARRPRQVPHRHGGATGPACLRVVLHLGSASGSARPSHASGQAPRLLPAPPHRCHERECVAAEDHCGDARPLRHRGQRAAAPPIDVNARLQRRRYLPPPVLSNAPPQACFPSSLSATPPSARSRLRGRLLGVVGLLRGRSRGAARAAPAPSFLCPLANRRMRIRFGRASLGAPEIVPAGPS